MKKLITAVAVLFCVAGAARADNARRSTSSSVAGHEKFLIGTDVEFALPVGSYADINGVGGSVLLNAEYLLMPEISGTVRIGFQYHTSKNVLGTDVYMHSVPVLVGGKYYLMPERQGLFAAIEFGAFDLIPSDALGSSEVKFGAGLGLGWSMKQWSARVNVHAHDLGHTGDSMMITGGVGYQFAGF